jgi:hypothetical protein
MPAYSIKGWASLPNGPPHLGRAAGATPSPDAQCHRRVTEWHRRRAYRPEGPVQAGIGEPVDKGPAAKELGDQTAAEIVRRDGA